MAEKRFQILNTAFQLCLVSEKREGKEGNGFFIFRRGKLDMFWILYNFLISFTCFLVNEIHSLNSTFQVIFPRVL
jgi:hypothetical protein